MPGMLHMVFTIKDSAMLGNHFYSAFHSHRTVSAFVHSFMKSNQITNSSHPDAVIPRLEMMACWLQDFPRQVSSVSDASIPSPHVLRFDNGFGLVCILEWSLLVTFAQALDVRNYPVLQTDADIDPTFDYRVLMADVRKRFKEVMSEEFNRHLGVRRRDVVIELPWHTLVCVPSMEFALSLVAYYRRHYLFEEKNDLESYRERGLNDAILIERLCQDLRTLQPGLEDHFMAQLTAYPDQLDRRQMVVPDFGNLEVFRKGKLSLLLL